MLEALRNDPERPGLDSGDRFFLTAAVSEHTRSLDNFREPPSVRLLFALASKRDHAPRFSTATSIRASPRLFDDLICPRRGEETEGAPRGKRAGPPTGSPRSRGGERIAGSSRRVLWRLSG